MLNEAEIRKALDAAKTNTKGRWDLFSCEPEQRTLRNGRLSDLWIIFESILELQRANNCPWEWSAIISQSGQCAFRRMSDGKLVVIGLNFLKNSLEEEKAHERRIQEAYRSLAEVHKEPGEIEGL